VMLKRSKKENRDWGFLVVGVYGCTSLFRNVDWGVAWGGRGGVFGVAPASFEEKVASRSVKLFWGT